MIHYQLQTAGCLFSKQKNLTLSLLNGKWHQDMPPHPPKWEREWLPAMFIPPFKPHDRNMFKDKIICVWFKNKWRSIGKEFTDELWVETFSVPRHTENIFRKSL